MNKIILILVIVVFALMAGSYFYLGLEERDSRGWLVNEENVRGSALIANGLNYTFNYAQQQGMLNEINNSKKVYRREAPSYTPGEVESILIYRFDLKEPLELIPVSDNYSLFKVKIWKEGYYLSLNQPEDLKNILEYAYDK